MGDRAATTSELFSPTADWHRLDPAYATARRLAALATNLLVSVIPALAVGYFFDPLLGWALLALGLAWTSWRVIRAGRWVRSFGYAERDQDLLISHGLWFKQLTAIPYGRMLSVDVQSGPIDRAWGLASVQLVTASPTSAARVPGLPMAEATALRDRLIARGQDQAMPL